MPEALDALDVDLLRVLQANPRVGVLELSRLLGVARGTVQARVDRLERSGALADVEAELTALPAVLEAYATTGSSDLLCRIAASSHEDLQNALLALNNSPYVGRSTSVVLLSTVVAPRTLPLLASQPRDAPRRAPAYRDAL
jgi:DNA-binding Lrp family transcriptional regulator